MTLREALAAQLPLQARQTHEVRLARAFVASALTRASLADLLADAWSLLTPFRRLTSSFCFSPLNRQPSWTRLVPPEGGTRLFLFVAG